MPQSEPTPGNLVGHFKILERLGQGGMGTVYKALDLKLDRLVALKFISPDLARDSTAISRFQREARLASQLLHPNIATIFEFNAENAQLYLAMEFIQGRTVRQQMRGRPLGAEALVKLAAGMAAGLAEAHKKGILHRDIKPGNVVFSENGGIKILDFGLAKAMDAFAIPQDGLEDRVTEVATDSGQLMGTYGYMPPEVLCGRRFLPASDLFSFGVVLYEAATGANPFTGATPALVISSILNHNPAPPSTLAPGLGPQWDEIILRCLQKNPEDRFAHAGELLKHIESEFLPIQASQSTPKEARPRLRRGRWHWAASILALALTLLILSTWISRRIQAPEQAAPGYSPKLVVLPFRQTGDDPRYDQSLAECVTEEVYARLSQVSGLRILSPSAAASYREQYTAARLRSVLGVDAALTGLARQNGDETAFQVSLTDCRSGKQSWNRDFILSPVLLDLNQISGEIARSVVQTLGVPVQKSEEARLGRMPGSNLEAYQSYREGRNLLSRYSQQSTDQAILAFESALKRDPSLVEAYVGIAEAYFTMAAFGWMEPDPAYMRAEMSAKIAVKFNPRLSDAHRMLANLYSMREGRLDLAESHYRQAIEYERSNVMARSWLAMEYAYQGRFKEAMIEIGEARELDPFSALVVFYYGGIKYLSGDCLEGAIWAEKAILDMKSQLALAHLLSGASHLCLNRVADARLALETGLRQPNSPTWALAAARMEGLLAVCDLRENRRDAFRRSLAAMETKYTKDHVYAYPLAVAFAADGTASAALQWLQRAVQKRAFGWQEIRFDPFLAPLRNHPGFQELLRQLPIRPAETQSPRGRGE